MKLVNRSQQYMYWQTFNYDDNVASTQWAIARDHGSLAPGKDTTTDASGRVQIKVFTSMNPIVSLPGPFSVPAPAINASKSNLFDDSMTVVFTGEQLVKLDSDYFKLVGLAVLRPGSAPPGVSVDVTKVVRSILTIAEALVSNLWTDTPTKWTQAGVFKVALALVDIFGAASSPDRLSITEINTVVQDLIDQNEARTRAPSIYTASFWLDKWVDKSRSLAVGGAVPSTKELTDYDRQQFVQELDGQVDGRSGFFAVEMAVFQANRTIRQYAIPTYLLGVMLHLHFKILSLCVKQEHAPLDLADINDVRRLADAYAKTLPECEDDYKGFCTALSNRYPLGINLADVGRTDSIIVYADPQPEEAVQLGNAAVKKYLQGDRMIIAKSGDKLKQFIAALDKMRVV